MDHANAFITMEIDWDLVNTDQISFSAAINVYNFPAISFVDCNTSAAKLNLV